MDILEIEILTNNLDETEGFYSKNLGLEIVNKDHNSISFLAGQSTLTFVKTDKLKPKYHFAFNIPHNKLDEAIMWTSAKVDLIKNADNEIVTNFENWNAKAIYFYDNNANIVEFIARFDLKNETSKPFDISSIQSISEIGIVTDAPIKLADRLAEENNINSFAKGFKSETFATLGNDNGLFIIVATNRKWYPTVQEAEKHYTKVKISTNGLTREIILNQQDLGS